MDVEGFQTLTPRERDVLTALGGGRSSKQVARELGLSVETVRSYTKRIYATLDVHNRAEATVAAIALGLVEGQISDGGEPADPRDAIAAPIRAVIGREKELAALVDRLAEQRLVSIVGIGGAGKTVLARVVARAHIAASGDRGSFVPLEHLADEVGLAMAIADALGVHMRRRSERVWDELVGLADDAPRLLVLDNLEHLTDHADRIVGLLKALPSLRLLTTSRRPLGIAEEAVVRIDGLSFPDDDLPSAEQHGAVQLFLSELARLDSQRTVISSDLRLVGDICRRVGGLPLAVVLAAGWIDVLSLEDISTQLVESSGLLTSESAVPERHRSLDALVDQAIERRPFPERQVLARMSVFDGGFDRAAAEDVAGATLQRLASLIRGSLVRHDPITERYDLHPLVRARAAALLERRHEAEATAAAHSDHYATYVSSWAEAMAGRPEPPGQREAVEAYDRERNNIRAAWLHAVGCGDTDNLLAMLHTVAMWLDHKSDLLECDVLLSAALESPVAEELWPRLVLHREYIRFQAGSVDPATCRVHEALEALETAGSDWLEPAEIITAYLEVAVLGRPEDAFERVRRLTSPDADTPPFWRHRGQMLMAFMHAAMGDTEAALAAHRQGMQDAIDAGDYSAAHVQTIFVALGLIRVNRRNEIPEVLAEAEQLLELLPNQQTEASVQLVGLILAVFAGEEVDQLEQRLEHAVLVRLVHENQHMANLQNGAMSLARGARGDREAARRGRDAQDEEVAAGFFGESVLWAELGMALAAAAHGDVDEARSHAEAGRSWQQDAGLVTSEVDVVLRLVDAVAAGQNGDHDRSIELIDEALSSPSLLEPLLRKSAAVSPASATP